MERKSHYPLPFKPETGMNMAEKVLGNDPFADMGMTAPTLGRTKKAPVSGTGVRTDKAQKTKQPKKTDNTAAKAESAAEPGTVSKKPLENIPQKTKKDLPENNKKKAVPVVSEHTADKTVSARKDFSEKKTVTAEPENASVNSKRLHNNSLTENSEHEMLQIERSCRSGIIPIFESINKFLKLVKVEGAKNIPSGGRALLVVNHAGIAPLDGFLIRIALNIERPQIRDVHPLLEDFFYQTPILKTLLTRLGMGRACDTDAAEIFGKGKIALLFLEGLSLKEKPYSRRHELQRFSRGGFIRTAIKTNTPIIPTAIFNCAPQSIAPLASGLFPACSRIVIGEPIDSSNYAADSEPDPMLMSELSRKIRATIQGMLKDGMK